MAKSPKASPAVDTGLSRVADDRVKTAKCGDAHADTNLVRYSRAGDKFHYRWAARRCLRMISPLSPVRCITIEGSKESKAAGEYLIDVAEYSLTPTKSESVAYYQLKHSTTRTKIAFSLSEIQTTLKGFAARFSASRRTRKGRNRECTFWFVSNRPVSARVKSAAVTLGRGGKVSARLKSDLERATTLKGEDLRAFCSSLSFEDAEGDYIVQKQKLRGEVAEFIAGFIDSQESSNLVELVEDRAMPKSEDGRVDGRIYREDVLQRLGVNSERDLFPAPRAIEPLQHAIRREQHGMMLKEVLRATVPLLIHAEGGVGKSVVARQLAESLPNGSFGVVYDCFGAGKYRNESEPRHRPCDALVQMANELAAKGLCRTLIGSAATPRDALFRAFIERVKEACASLREIERTALLVLLIDAPDNAEMAAAENGDRCFAGALLRETLPGACRLVGLCRTERMHLLKPSTRVRQVELKPFSEAETTAHLRSWYPDASDDDVREFHRLSSSNPRVQANALAGPYNNLPDLLSGLGPTRTTVDDQIAGQLDTAINRIRDEHTQLENEQVESICRGLANLPPFIPLPVLATVANVEVSTIKSFISEFGRPLWESDDSVQFRDEPTETWFQKRFSADPILIEKYAGLLEPFASTYSYIAKALPKLWLRAGNYERLISLALSDEHLPASNPIDERDIRVYRLQFAFKAALKVRRLGDATRLAFRAGEEMAGNQRQLDILSSNVDLVAQLQDAHRTQEYAYKGLLKGEWQGSENAYSASLLSFVKDFRGDARSYLRAADRWLQLYFEYAKRIRIKQPHFQDKLKTNDIVELAWANFHLFGAIGLVRFLSDWKPPHVIFDVTSKVVQRLIDAARFDEVFEIARRGARNVHLIIALSDELLRVAKFPPKESLRHTLGSLCSENKRISKPEWNKRGASVPAIVAFAEACAFRGLPRKQIGVVLDVYVPLAGLGGLESDHRSHERRTFFRAASLRMAIKHQEESDVKALLPEENSLATPQRQSNAENRKKLTEVIDALLPWYFARARLLTGHRDVVVDLADIHKRSETALSGRYMTYDPIPYELPLVHFEILAFTEGTTETDIDAFVLRVLTRSDAKFALSERIRVLRASYRLPHTRALCARLEESCTKIIETESNESPEERADWFIKLARAVLPVSPADAGAYFDRAIEAVSKFGDEMTDRWEALVAVATRATAEGPSTPEMAYRFVRCAEIVGATVVREKYWDRDDVFRVALRLDPAGAFAALSRWRDRGVGWFGEQVEALAIEAIKLKIISPSSGWSFSGFKGCNGSVAFLKACVFGEQDKSQRQRIFDAGVRDVALEPGAASKIKELSALASEAGLDHTQLDTGISQQTPEENEGILSREMGIPAIHEPPDQRIEDVLRGIDVITGDGIAKALRMYDEFEFPKQHDRFWNEMIALVPVGKETHFLRVLVGVEGVDYYDIRNVFSVIRSRWLKKPAVERAWPAFLTAIGKRFAVAFSQRHSLHYWLEGSSMTTEEIEMMKSGMVEALGDTPDMVSAGTFFGFIGTVAPRITPADAHSTLEFALLRFERHIDNDFADGSWAEWLQPPKEMVDAFAGLIWSALGAPHSSIRWEAAHCVRRLAELECQSEIDSLISWMKKGSVEAFGSHRFPFYRLHAQQYLLIALARIAVDNARSLRAHHGYFAHIALEGIPHLLIQKFAAEIALAIERVSPGTYAVEIVEGLGNVGISPLPPRIVNRDTEIRTPWHEKGDVRTDRKLYFAWDFDRYWFEPLAGVFGISQAEVIDLAQETAIEFVGVKEGDEHPEDPRNTQWRTLDYSRPNTSHDHGNYPQIDDYQFYYSYHALLSVGARLAGTMPVIKHANRAYEDDSWENWLERHQLTRSDGKWLADRRDPSPGRRRSWVFDQHRDDWLWRVTTDDFLDVITNYNPLPLSLCVNGFWSDCRNEYSEDVRVTTAFVHSDMASSLATALRSHPNSFQAEMPVYGETDDFNLPPFQLKGWIRVRGGSDPRLDHLDPYAKQISYPPNEVADSFATLLQLSPDYERRNWREASIEMPSVVSELWSERREGRHEMPFRHGNRMVACTKLLRKACALLQLDLVLCVKIRRDRERSYRSDRENYGYLESSHKVFIFSANGILSDATKDYQLG